jgi:hypothetical protein
MKSIPLVPSRVLDVSFLVDDMVRWNGTAKGSSSQTEHRDEGKTHLESSAAVPRKTKDRELLSFLT